MKNPLRYEVSRMRLRWASVALAFVVVLGLQLVAAQSAPARTFKVLYTFQGLTDGGEPYAGLVRDAAGNLYGTAISSGDFGWGVVFKVDTTGTETVLHSFGDGSTDGRTPYAGLVRDKAGNLYGTTYEGGGIGCVDGCGTVFKVDTTGTETVLHSFAGGTTDGCFPYAGLLLDSAGNLYGTTQACGASSSGIVFKVSKSGKWTILHNFAGGTNDGANPLYGSLIMDAKGALYGVAQYGGTSNQGVVYKLSKRRALTVLHSFAGGTTDGCSPYGTPTMDGLGNLYGTAVACGASNMGIVWKLRKKGAEKVLHNFAGGTNDGAQPIAGVILDAQGNLYGDTQYGGGTGCFGVGCGTVYKVSKTGTLTLLHIFAGPEGASPFGGVIRDAKGDVYGTAFLGGTPDWGTVWEISK
ncbi:MAG TPA: choice-of-anchor tandem repeat GloVer-containing protein [Terriglobales bacterium]|nr:choice-of-anchor tandem repeat GloVer-containing protein [Terriglobales bacterium]